MAPSRPTGDRRLIRLEVDETDIEGVCEQLTSLGLTPVVESLGSERRTSQLSAAPDLSADERSWLLALAAGSTIDQLASASAYSRRQMHRLLNRAYAGLGASGRVEALLIAQERGLLDRASEAPLRGPRGVDRRTP